MLAVLIGRGLAAIAGGLALLVAAFLLTYYVTEGVIYLAGIACALFIEWVFL